jgi:hypothetical protein
LNAVNLLTLKQSNPGNAARSVWLQNFARSGEVEERKAWVMKEGLEG